MTISSVPTTILASPSDESMQARLYEAIVQHQIPPGTKLTEDALSEAFGVSRTRVRKMLQALAHDQIVEIQPHRGAFVARPDPEEAREVFRARLVVEPALVIDAARSAGAQDIATLEAHLAKEHRAHQQGDHRRQIRLSGEFHLALARIGGNRTLIRFLGQLIGRTTLIIAVYGRTDHGSYCDGDHRELIGRLRPDRAEAAAVLMRAHLERLEKSVELRSGPDHGPLDLARIFADPMD